MYVGNSCSRRRRRRRRSSWHCLMRSLLKKWGCSRGRGPSSRKMGSISSSMKRISGSSSLKKGSSSNRSTIYNAISP
jgi:hypothetical protein